jgi:hypothetical protein
MPKRRSPKRRSAKRRSTKRRYPKRRSPKRKLRSKSLRMTGDIGKDFVDYFDDEPEPEPINLQQSLAELRDFVSQYGLSASAEIKDRLLYIIFDLLPIPANNPYFLAINQQQMRAAVLYPLREMYPVYEPDSVIGETEAFRIWQHPEPTRRSEIFFRWMLPHPREPRAWAAYEIIFEPRNGDANLSLWWSVVFGLLVRIGMEFKRAGLIR